MTAATTGINETNAQKSGFEVDTVILSPMSHAGYYPGGKVMTMKAVSYTHLLREDTVYDWKFVGLSHNTVRGAAGGAVLCGAAGYFTQRSYAAGVHAGNSRLCLATCSVNTGVDSRGRE